MNNKKAFANHAGTQFVYKVDCHINLIVFQIVQWIQAFTTIAQLVELEHLEETKACLTRQKN